jgi:hypothetical protein
MSEPIPPAGAPTPELPYVQRRLEGQRRWHSKKATWNKRWFYAAEIATLLAGALIPILNVWVIDDPWIARVLSSVLGAVVVIAAGVAKLFKFQENWLQYRAIAESLGRERELYAGKVADYAIADDKREALLVERIEALLATTTTRFITTHRTAAPQAGEPPAPA